MTEDQPAGEDGAEESPQTEPPTSTAELEGGIFNMMITLVQLHQIHGASKSQACTVVADLMEHYASALRQLQ